MNGVPGPGTAGRPRQAGNVEPGAILRAMAYGEQHDEPDSEQPGQQHGQQLDERRGGQRMEPDQRIVIRVHCQIEVVVDDPEAVLSRAERELRESEIDWTTEPDTVDEAVAELRADLARSLASLV